MKKRTTPLFWPAFLALFAFSESARNEKLLFQYVRFPNDPCQGSLKNGTCYTKEECNAKGGFNDGNCAQGYGVCCVFAYGCGASSSENGSYFESPATLPSGSCKFQVCKQNADICQIRLDLQTFVISGPSTITQNHAFRISGTIQGSSSTGVGVADATTCRTDIFRITNQRSVPELCGTNTGYHVYFKPSGDCNDLTFFLGEEARGIASIARRSWSIKIHQYSCNYDNLAPEGCTQYFSGSNTNTLESFNWAPQTLHLSNQLQTICIRREIGMCRICYSATSPTSVDIYSYTDGAANTGCLTYNTNGLNELGWDAIVIPGARTEDTDLPIAKKQCVNDLGLVSSTQSAGGTTITVCSREFPFRIHFYSDDGEVGGTTYEANDTNRGFQIGYFMTSC